MNDLISRQDAIRVASGFCHPANIAKELAKLPSAQPETHDKRTETHSCDCIDRQVAIDDLKCKDPSQIWDTADVEVWVNALPSAQPEPPEWAQKVEEYRKCAPSYVQKPLAWALYQVWKEYDR